MGITPIKDATGIADQLLNTVNPGRQPETGGSDLSRTLLISPETDLIRAVRRFLQRMLQTVTMYRQPEPVMHQRQM